MPHSDHVVSDLGFILAASMARVSVAVLKAKLVATLLARHSWRFLPANLAMVAALGIGTIPVVWIVEVGFEPFVFCDDVRRGERGNVFQSQEYTAFATGRRVNRWWQNGLLGAASRTTHHLVYRRLQVNIIFSDDGASAGAARGTTRPCACF
jgi:hypothetical protein